MGQQLLSLLLPQRSRQSSTHGAGALPSPGCFDRNSQPPSSAEGGEVGTEAPHCLLKELHLQICSLEQHNCILPPAPAPGLALPECSICSLFQLFKKNKIILSPTQTCITPALLGEIHLSGETPPDSCAAELSTRAFLSSYYHKARAAWKQDFKSSDSHQ